MPTLHHAKVLQYAAAIGNVDTVPLHGDCVAPITMMIRGHDSPLLSALRDWREDRLDYADGYGLIGERSPIRAATGYISVRCRQCETCLRKRSHQWAARARVEILAAQRNWFGTLTFSPEQRFLLTFRAAARLQDRGGDGKDVQFGELVNRASPLVTKFLKRVRKNSGARLRYLIAWEPHKDGFPHAHMLVHEIDGTVVKRALEREWRHGFSHWRLVDDQGPQAAFYVAKYLAKNAQARVRASQQYGRDSDRRLTERLLAVTRAASEAQATTNATTTHV